MNNDDSLRYPIGKFQPKESYTTEEIQEYIKKIETFPSHLEETVKKLTTAQLDTPYRAGGWTIRQVLHHLSDSHMNAYIRTKWTLTEATPTIKAYDEKAWAETPEIKLDPQVSINLLKAIHQKWVALLRLVKPEDFKKSFLHPETNKYVSLGRQMATYAWHGEHHLGHVKIVMGK
jgi:hypothetical protein